MLKVKLNNMLGGGSALYCDCY